MSECLFKAGTTYYSLNSNGEIIYSDTMPEKFAFDSYNYFIKTDVKISKSSTATATLATLTSNKYPLKNKYYKSINSVTSNINSKFLIQDGTSLYSVNPLTLIKSVGDVTTDEIATHGQTTVALTKEELKSLSDSAVLLSYVDTAEGLQSNATFDVSFTRSFLCTLEQSDVKFLYYNLDAPLLDTVEICGLEKSSFSYKVSIDGVTDPLVSETVNDDVDSSIIIPSTQFTTSENPYHVKIEVIDEKLKTYSKTTTLSLQNTEPNILVTMTNMIARIDFNDADQNRIKYKVFLNGNQITPSIGQWTDFVNTPTYFMTRFRSTDIIVGGNNILRVVAEDEYGKQGQVIYNFTGELSGLLFTDEDNNVCSDDLGNIIRTFNMGKINAGKTSETKLVKIKNTCGYDVINANIQIEAIDPNSRYTVFISKENNPFTDSNNLSIAKISNNTEDYFYVKVVTDPDIENGGNFYINVQSEPSR